MTASTDIGRMVASWLEDVDPTEIPAASIDRALGSARRIGQRRGVRALLAGADAWPVAARDVRIPRISARPLLVTALLLALAVAAALIAGALLAERTPFGGGGWITVTERGSTHILSPDGSGITRRAGAYYCPHLAPTGDALVYARRFGPLVLEPFDGSVQTTFGDLSTLGFGDGIWSPDGTRLAMRSSIDGDRAAFRVLSILDGSVTTLLETARADELIGEAWSPDSEKVAIAHGTVGQMTIDIVDLTGARRSPIGPLVVEGFGAMHWSPDGSRLAFVSFVATEPAKLVVIDVQTGAATEVLTGSMESFWPVISPWSRDGQWIAVGNGERTLSIVRPDGSGRTDVALGGPIEGYPRWSPVENTVAVADSATLVTLGADGSGRIDRPSWGARVQFGPYAFGWSPDGSQLVGVTLESSSDRLTLAFFDAATDRPPTVVRYDPPLDPVPAPRDPVCMAWVPPPTTE